MQPDVGIPYEEAKLKFLNDYDRTNPVTMQ